MQRLLCQHQQQQWQILSLLFPVELLALIAAYIEIDEDLLEFATWSHLMYTLCRAELHKRFSRRTLQMTAGLSHILLLTPDNQAICPGSQ